MNFTKDELQEVRQYFKIRTADLRNKLTLIESTLAKIDKCGVNDTDTDTGTFTDPRDSQTYRTVKMPDGKIWMAQNLNYITSDSWCYGNDPANGKKYGRLYTWGAAIKACPSGWHLPSREEWDNLLEAVGSNAGKKLKSKSGWNSGGNGTDDYGFSALPGGRRNNFDGSFNTAGGHGFWWSATERGSSYAYIRLMYYNYDSVDEDYNYKVYGFSVRCLRD
jgi:uncharacterized protein (TIGR02145 family)